MEQDDRVTSAGHLPRGTPPDHDALDEELSSPPEFLVRAVSRWTGHLAVIGAGGKMGPTLARMAKRAFDRAGLSGRVYAVSRFSDPAVRDRLEKAGVETVPLDLAEPDAAASLPEAERVVYMAGQKFGTDALPSATWASNVLLAAKVAKRYRKSRIAAFSTGNVYPLTPVVYGGSRECDAPGPVGEYAQSALGRERILEHLSRLHGTPMTLIRLNYAVEYRYGVLADLADLLLEGRPIDLRMGAVNVIWQTDACAMALGALDLAESPPRILNVTGPETASVRSLARDLGERLERTPLFSGSEGENALLSNASQAFARFGYPSVCLAEAVERTARYLKSGGRLLGRPTHFAEREGRF